MTGDGGRSDPAPRRPSRPPEPSAAPADRPVGRQTGGSASRRRPISVAGWQTPHERDVELRRYVELL